ncbi:hypothetical protein SBV1_2110008 [Verrucomicrobia bacterium]|nr:hypothetical protein SBV1_2110008 [Verrucomicrobiota bacterium]
MGLPGRGIRRPAPFPCAGGSAADCGDETSPPLSGAGALLKGDRFVDQHDGDVLPEGIKQLAVGSEQAVIEPFFDHSAGPVLQSAGGDLEVYLLEQGRRGWPHGLMRFRTAQKV